MGFSHAITIPGAPVENYNERDPSTWVFEPVETDVAAHHILIMQAIERCVRTPYGRLMIFMPPGAAKSTYTSAVAPAWAMGAFPGTQVIMASYASTPIERHSKRARQIVSSPLYRNLWEKPIAPVSGSFNAHDWELTNGSRLYAAGLLGAITSTRCDLGIIDDPVKGRQQADSEIERRNTRNAYEDDFMTRLKPQASIIMMLTRWHEDDLAGGILPEHWRGESGQIMCRDGQVWEVLCLPMIARRADDPLGRKIGERLWPEWFSERHISMYKRNPRTWGSLFQQDPQPESGGQVEKKHFHRFNLNQLPKDHKTWVQFGTGDYAVTKKMIDTDPDFTVMGRWKMDPVGDLWLMPDGYYGQEAIEDRDDHDKPSGWIQEWIRMTQDNDISDWFAEAGVIRRSTEPTFRKKIERKKLHTSLTFTPTGTDKIANFQGFRALARAGKVHIANGAFGDYVLDQVCRFPFARYDDAADMCSQAGIAQDHFYDPVDDEAEEQQEREEREARTREKQRRAGTFDHLDHDLDDDEETRAREEYTR